jgi:hypothetical protein
MKGMAKLSCSNVSSNVSSATWTSSNILAQFFKYILNEGVIFSYVRASKLLNPVKLIGFSTDFI